MLTSKYQQRVRLSTYSTLLVLLILGALSPGFILNINDQTRIIRPSGQMNDVRVLVQPKLLKHPYNNVQHTSRTERFDPVGYQRTFWVQNFTDFTHYIVSATLLASGEFSAIFITNACITIVGEATAIEYAENIREEFDTTIYPRITDLAGHPNGTLGDIDGDQRIVILVSQNLVSYYSQANELPISPSNPNSNECEMFYLYYWTWLLPTLAHEFHHLIWFNTEMDEQQFALEGLATYAQYYAGYLGPYDNLDLRVPVFLTHPEDSLLYWNGFNEEGLSSSIDYGGAYLFAFYIAEQYGVDILRNLISEPTDGPEGIEATLQAAGYALTFNDLYLDWITAVTVDELGFSNNRYGFEDLDARISHYTPVILPHHQQSLSLRYYGIHVHKITSPSDTFSVQIHKVSNVTIGLSTAYHDTHGWHVRQHILTDGQTTFTDNIAASGIDEAHIITSYLSNSTPPGHREYGLGPSTTIQLTLTTTSPTTRNPIGTLGVIVVLGVIVTIAIVVVMIIKKQHHLRQNGTKDDLELASQKE